MSARSALVSIASFGTTVRNVTAAAAAPSVATVHRRIVSRGQIGVDRNDLSAYEQRVMDGSL